MLFRSSGFALLYSTRFNVGLMQFYANILFYLGIIICNIDIYNKLKTIDHEQIRHSNDADRKKKIPIRIVKTELISVVILIFYIFLYDFNTYPLIIQSMAILCYYFLWKSQKPTIGLHAAIIWFNMLIALGLNQFTNIVEIYLFFIIIGLKFLEKALVRNCTTNYSLKNSFYSAFVIVSLKIYILFLNYSFILFIIPIISSVIIDIIIFQAFLQKSNHMTPQMLNKMQNFSLGFIIIAIFIFQL